MSDMVAAVLFALWGFAVDRRPLPDRRRVALSLVLRVFKLPSDAG